MIIWEYIPLQKHKIPILGTIAHFRTLLGESHSSWKTFTGFSEKKKKAPNTTTNSPNIYIFSSIYTFTRNPLYFKSVELKSSFFKLLDFFTKLVRDRLYACLDYPQFHILKLYLFWLRWHTYKENTEHMYLI